MSRTGIFTECHDRNLGWERGCPRSLCLILLFLSVVPAYSGTASNNQVLAHDRLGDITQGEMALYRRSKEHTPSTKSNSQENTRNDIEEYSALRILAASAESERQDFIDTPSVRWGLWKVRTAEAYTRFMEEVFTPDRNPSSEEIEKYYREHQKDFEIKGHIRFRSIFLDATRCPDEPSRRELERKAEEILAALVGSATIPAEVPLDRFLEVASEAMGQPTSSFEIRGPFPLGQISPSIEKTALSLEPGQVGPVITVKHGFQILRLESKALPGIHPLEEVRTRIREILRVRETQGRRKDFIDRMVDSGDLEVSQEGLAALLRSATDPLQASSVMLSPAFEGGLTVGKYLEYLDATGTALRQGDDPDEKVMSTHRDTIQRFLLVPDLTYQEAEATGLTSDATFQERLKVGNILFLGNLYLKRLVHSRLEKQPRITVEEIRAYYESHPDEFMSKEEYLLREILVRIGEAASPPAIEFAYREAEEKVLMALQQIHNGSSEEELIREISQGAEASQGGLTGWVLSGTRYSHEIWKVLAEVPNGTWCRQVFRFGGSVIALKVEDRKASERIPLGECHMEIFSKLESKRYRDEEEWVKREARKGLKWTG